jgi:hypothetical protein
MKMAISGDAGAPAAFQRQAQDAAILPQRISAESPARSDSVDLRHADMTNSSAPFGACQRSIRGAYGIIMTVMLWTCRNLFQLG